MGWFTDKNKDTELLKKLQDKYGKDKSQDDILAELEAGAAAKSTAEAEVARAATAMQERDAAVGELERVKAQLAEIEAGSQRRDTNPNQPQRPPSVLVDEDAAFNARLNPLILAQFNQSAVMAKTLAQQQLRSDPKTSKLFTKYQKEVDDYFARVPLAQQCHVESYINCYRIVVGGHLDEIASEAAKGNGALFSETPAGSPPQNSTADPNKLTPEEIQQAAKMRVTPERYLEQKKKMRFLGY